MNEVSSRGGLKAPTRVVVATAKGGVGKTSVSTSLADQARRALWSAEGEAAGVAGRVLLIDLDPQGNGGVDLGYPAEEATPGNLGWLTDMLAHLRGRDTEAAVGALDRGLMSNVRDGLDVLPGGPGMVVAQSMVIDAPSWYQAATRDHPHYTLYGAMTWGQVWREVLSIWLQRRWEAGEGYSLVIIDTPPGEEYLGVTAIAGAELLLVPARTDRASTTGALEQLAGRLQAARVVNPDLRLAGILLFGVNRRAKVINEAARTAIRQLLGDGAPILPVTIRYSEAVATAVRREGKVPAEIAEELEALGGITGIRLAALRRRGQAPADVPTTPDGVKALADRAVDARGVTDDYQRLWWNLAPALVAGLSRPVGQPIADDVDGPPSLRVVGAAGGDSTSGAPGPSAGAGSSSDETPAGPSPVVT